MVDQENIESVRSELSSRGLIDRDWKILSENGKGYIPVTKEDETEYPTTRRDLDQRENKRDVSEILGYKPTYEWLGDLILLGRDVEGVDEVVDAFKQSQHDFKSILKKLSSVEGKERIRKWKIVYGNSSETVHKEFGYEYKLDIQEVYFSPRLATERQRIQNRLPSEFTMVDMFCGVGPYAVPAADVGGDVVAVDINENAVEYLRENARRNNVKESIHPINDDIRDVSIEYSNYATHIVMNLPHTANQFISSAERIAQDGSTVFYYDFMHEEDTVKDIVDELNGDLSSSYVELENFRSVRPYAPKVDNVCLDLKIYKD